jgi:hypothetical protein
MIPATYDTEYYSKDNTNYNTQNSVFSSKFQTTIEAAIMTFYGVYVFDQEKPKKVDYKYQQVKYQSCRYISAAW